MHILSNVKLYLEEGDDDKDEYGADFRPQKNGLNKIYWGEEDDFLGKFCISCVTLFRFICKVQRALKVSLNLNSHNVINVYSVTLL